MSVWQKAVYSGYWHYIRESGVTACNRRTMFACNPPKNWVSNTKPTAKNICKRCQQREWVNP